jgi:hypothetical protein
MVKSIHEYKTSGKMKNASYKEVVDWIIHSLNDVKVANIMHDFSKTKGESFEIFQNNDVQVNWNRLFDENSNLIGEFNVDPGGVV